MDTIEQESADEAGWKLPVAYPQMNSNDQSAAMRACILKFLDKVGRATLSNISTALGATHEPTVRRHLQYLASTQQVYVDPIGRDPIYFRNGRLAHPLLQANVRAGHTTEYVIRTYADPLTGRSLTITEYSISPLGEKKAKSGLRIDVADLPRVLEELERIKKTIDQDPSLLGGSLVR